MLQSETLQQTAESGHQRPATSLTSGVSSPLSWGAWFSSHHPTACARRVAWRALKKTHKHKHITPSYQLQVLLQSSAPRCLSEGEAEGKGVRARTRKVFNGP